jgi:hypothetical protein
LLHAKALFFIHDQKANIFKTDVGDASRWVLTTVNTAVSQSDENLFARP